MLTVNDSKKNLSFKILGWWVIRDSVSASLNCAAQQATG